MTLWIAIAVLTAAAIAALALAVRRAGGRSDLALLTALAVPGIALASYAFLGTPEMPDQPYAARADATVHAEMRGLLAELEKKLEADPSRLDGWLLLARSRMKVGDHDAAARAFRRARGLAPDSGEIASELGEALVHAAGGTVNEDARAVLLAAHAKDPRDTRALFYLGHDAASRADHAAAVQFWTDLVAVSPPGAPWLPDIRGRIQRQAAIGNVDLATVTPSVQPTHSAPPGPSAEDAAAAAAMSPEERAAFIRSMVDRLAARLAENPDDLEGWKRLANAWRVLGESDKAAEAEARVRALEGRK